MKYGFVIDNRKCIGCHACTTACKSEHEVPVGVNRTWVKQVEKGTFPDTKRLFSVMRCNHCTDAPCVSICPTESLYFRKDGIVDFDKDRCIGCKSCMQACPYDALYIDPETHTAAKCNYCAHRIDVGLEPACVNVCPEHAIISGDMDNPSTEIARLLAEHETKTRKPEAGTIPNVFYIDAEDDSLVPSASETLDVSLWGSQSHGVGHFAKQAEKMAFSNTDLVGELVKLNGGYDVENSISQKYGETPENENVKSPKTVEVLMNQTKEVYNTPNKGILWGWEVSAYVWTKAISAGAFLVPFISWLFGIVELDTQIFWVSVIVGLIFLTLTGIFLVMDLDQPKRFIYVLLRPHWGSWLVKGGYAITAFGGLLTLLGGALYFQLDFLIMPILVATGLIAAIVAMYTAFLFAQAKGREFWQKPFLSALHMFIHSLMAGAGIFILISQYFQPNEQWSKYLGMIVMIGICFNLVIMMVELYQKHSSADMITTIRMIRNGRYKNLFWGGAILFGNIIPFITIGLSFSSPWSAILSSLCVLVGIYITEHIWVEAPQRIQLS